MFYSFLSDLLDVHTIDLSNSKEDLHFDTIQLSTHTVDKDGTVWLQAPPR